MVATIRFGSCCATASGPLARKDEGVEDGADELCEEEAGGLAGVVAVCDQAKAEQKTAEDKVKIQRFIQSWAKLQL